MPKFMKLFEDKEKAKRKRYVERKRNYTKGRFGNRLKEGSPFNKFEKFIIVIHVINDRWLAKQFGSSTNGIQAMRWRIKKNYLNLYRMKGGERK